tara:strand:+ start:2531 stop:3688 length:1158 start_codon:yes stop_codon:yes gene_type:complete
MLDILIIGGGINGAGIARDAAGRGLKVCLVEKNKIGSATSSWSTKLIHGGLRYLENYEFRLVRESLKEREIIKKIAPRITREIPFVIPHSSNLRPMWLIRLGLLLYDNIGGKTSIPKSKIINLKKEFSSILKNKYTKGFIYYDLQVDDKKLTELNAYDAINNNAKILENTEVIKTQRNKNYWDIYLSNKEILQSKILVNAAGPWINDVQNNIIKVKNNKSIRLVKGSHIITKKIHNLNTALTLQNSDKRIIFVIPYKNNTSLIGTTEVEVKNPNQNQIEDAEISYLIDSVNKYLDKPLLKDHIISTYSGIRPLIEDFKSNASKVTRDYVFDLNSDDNLAPLLSIYGGKLTTYRKLAENVILELKDYLPEHSKKSWTGNKILPDIH